MRFPTIAVAAVAMTVLQSVCIAGIIPYKPMLKNVGTTLGHALNQIDPFEMRCGL
jgi:hypothetical protein